MRVVSFLLLGVAACADQPTSLGDDLADRQLPSHRMARIASATTTLCTKRSTTKETGRSAQRP
jgi:hypothetical protein